MDRMKLLKTNWVGILVLLVLIGWLDTATADSKPGVKPAYGSGDLQKPLEVKGQTRNLSMNLLNQNQVNKVKFVWARSHYRDEILNTQY